MSADIPGGQLGVWRRRPYPAAICQCYEAPGHARDCTSEVIHLWTYFMESLGAVRLWPCSTALGQFRLLRNPAACPNYETRPTLSSEVRIALRNDALTRLAYARGSATQLDDTSGDAEALVFLDSTRFAKTTNKSCMSIKKWWLKRAEARGIAPYPSTVQSIKFVAAF